MKDTKFRLIVAAAGLLLLAAGCSSGGASGPSFLGEPERALTTGDWNDVDAAVEAAVSKKGVEMSVLSFRDEEGGTRVYELRTIGDEPARLVVQRTMNEGASGTRGGKLAPEVISMEAWVGRFGDRDRERALIAAVRSRLGDLSGVDFAPLR